VVGVDEIHRGLILEGEKNASAANLLNVHDKSPPIMVACLVYYHSLKLKLVRNQRWN
jgi:hypothetical protein